MSDVIREPRVKVFAPPPWDRLDPAKLRLVQLALGHWPPEEIEKRLAISRVTRWRWEREVAKAVGAADFHMALRNADADAIPAET